MLSRLCGVTMRAEVEAVQARFLLLLQARFLLLLLHHVVVSVVVASEAEARMRRVYKAGFIMAVPRCV